MWRKSMCESEKRKQSIWAFSFCVGEGFGRVVHSPRTHNGCCLFLILISHPQSWIQTFFTYRYRRQNGVEVVIHLNLQRNISYRQKAKCKQRPAHRYDAKSLVCIKLSDIVVIQCHYKWDYLLIRQRERFSAVHRGCQI